MIKAIIRFIREEGSEQRDDIIRIHEEDGSGNFRVTFCAEDMRRSNEFYADRSRVLDYISEVLVTLTYDTAPFESVQVDTAIHPSILYSVSDLTDGCLRRLVEDTVDTALRRQITRSFA
jgi:hypothetical protein